METRRRWRIVLGHVVLGRACRRLLVPFSSCPLVAKRRAGARKFACPIVLLAVLFTGGCVTRRITVRSNPPGALVYIDKYEIGRTPCSVEYIYYGTREIKLIKDGFETLTVLQWIPPPFYEIPGIDFVSETVVPFEIRDERTFNYQLVPTCIVPTNQLLGRAENLRQATKLERLAAGPPAPPPPAVRPRLLPPPPQQQAPPLGPPPGGRGYFVQPGGQPMPNFAPPPGYGAPGLYPQPGLAPEPGLLPSPGPLPPRGPQ
jgi:hypothetical protein